MKKRHLIIMLFLIILVGCNTNNVNNNIVETVDTNEEKDNKSDYDYKNIKKIIIGDQAMMSGLVAYKDFSIEIIERIGDKYGIPIEIFNSSSLEDNLIAIENNDADVIIGLTKTDNPNVEFTYSYLSSPMYFPNGVEFDIYRHYKMGVHKDNKELLQLLNDEIALMKGNGELETLYNEYFKERDSKEHISMDDLSRMSTLEKMTSEEREKILTEIEEYIKGE